MYVLEIDLYVCQKRPICVSKETYIQETPPISHILFDVRSAHASAIYMYFDIFACTLGVHIIYACEFINAHIIHTHNMRV